MPNKVEFGLSNVHFGTYTYDAETKKVTLGAPYHLPGAVNLSLEVEAGDSPFHADNGVYYNSFSSAGSKGELEMALFPDEFKQKFLGYKKTKDGGVTKPFGATSGAVYMAFEADGDKNKTRVILYNCALGEIQREYSTTEKSKEPVTEKLPFSCSGDTATGIWKSQYTPEAAGYASIFTSPEAPVLSDTVEGA